MRTTIFAALVGLLAAAPALAQNWGSIKGQVVWTDDALPKVGNVDVTKDQDHCLAKGAIVKDELLVDSKSKGVQNVMIWLAPAATGGKVPIHPSLQAIPQQPVVIDQPMCMFEPRITMMRAGQTLIIKNSAPKAHNSRISGNPDINGTKNPTIPPGGKYELSGDKALKAEKRPLLLACDIHGWMGGRIGVFDHPYFAVTDKDGNFEIKDAPAGNFIIYIQHEKAGWLHQGRTSKGQPVTIPAGGALDLGKIALKGEYLK